MQPSKLLAIASFCAVFGVTAAAHAASTMESRPWGTVVWEDRAGACASAVSVSNLVEQGLGASDGHDPLFVRAEVERARVGRTRASLFLRRGSAIAVRDLDAASCEELARSSAVIIAMAYELGLDPQPPPAEPPKEEPAATPAPVAEPPVVAAPAEADHAKEPPRTQYYLVVPRAVSLAPVMDYGTLPDLSAGVRGRFARDFGIIGIALQGIYLPNASQTRNDVKLDVGYAAGGLRLFRGWHYRDWTFEITAGMALGTYFADAGAAPLKNDGKAPYAVVEASLESSYRITNAFHLRTALEQAVHLNRAAYSSNDRSVWSPAGAAYRVSIGPEIVF